LSHLSDVPPDTIIDLGSWEGEALANAMRGSKAAELPWWQLIPMDKFVALIFTAIGMRKDDQVMRSLTGFLAGFAMTVTPGKLGELLKAYLFGRSDGLPAASVGAIVIAERLTDVLGLVVVEGRAVRH
jgi:hypothetical protein